jgi:hypothetical protein
VRWAAEHSEPQPDAVAHDVPEALR